jgi:hypothetical protein
MVQYAAPLLSMLAATNWAVPANTASDMSEACQMDID